MKRLFSVALLATLIVSFVFTNVSVFAFDDIYDPGFYSEGTPDGILDYLPGSDCGSLSSIISTTSNTDSVATAYNYFVGKGLSALQSAAIVGSLQEVSNLDPTSVNSATSAYGIAQWSGVRLTPLLLQTNSDTLSVQLDYVWSELTSPVESISLATLKASSATTAGDLAVLFATSYQGYPLSGMGNPAADANTVYSTYGNSSSTTNTGACSFVYYSQLNPSWASDTYGNGTIGTFGCGPTSLAMIVATLYGNGVTPEAMASLAMANNAYEDGVGTEHSVLLKAASAQYGFTYTNITGNMTEAISAVQSGDLVYMAGTGPAPFTTDGHVVVIRGVSTSSDGQQQLIIADPYRGSQDVYSVSTVEASVTTMYEISKQ